MKLVRGLALKLTGIGLAMTVPVSFAVSRAMVSLIFGVVGLDLAIVAGFAVLLLSVAIAAVYLRARRAIRVDLMVSLRCG